MTKIDRSWPQVLPHSRPNPTWGRPSDDILMVFRYYVDHLAASDNAVYSDGHTDLDAEALRYGLNQLYTIDGTRDPRTQIKHPDGSGLSDFGVLLFEACVHYWALRVRLFSPHIGVCLYQSSAPYVRATSLFKPTAPFHDQGIYMLIRCYRGSVLPGDLEELLEEFPKAAAASYQLDRGQRKRRSAISCDRIKALE